MPWGRSLANIHAFSTGNPIVGNTCLIDCGPLGIAHRSRFFYVLHTSKFVFEPRTLTRLAIVLTCWITERRIQKP